VSLSNIQKKILEILKESGGIEPHILSEQLQIRTSDLERDIAALRHMEKLRAALRDDGKKILLLW
jgi:predicted HTH transcriptional regulator